MFRHMAILKFKPDAKQADIDAYFAAFPGLMAEPAGNQGLEHWPEPGRRW